MSEAEPQELEVFQTPEGRSPFSEWIQKLKDRAVAVWRFKEDPVT
jgi:hypothetical protein